MASDGREGGFIKLHRRLKSWPLWRAMSAAQRQVWVELLLSANWKDEDAWYGPQRYTVKRGQLAHSEATIAKEAKVGRQVVRDTFVRLLAEGAVTREPAMAGTQVPWLTTIVNYERFQGNDDEENPPPNRPRTTEEPAENQPRTPREEREEGKKEEERPEDKPPAPAAELFRLGTDVRQQTTGPVAGRGALKRPPPAVSGRTPDPLRRELSDALVSVGREERGGAFAFDGAKDGQGVTRLLGWSRDVADHARRFRLALRAPAVEFGYRVDTIAAFATGRVWNHFAAPAQAAPQRLAKLGSPGSV